MGDSKTNLRILSGFYKSTFQKKYWILTVFVLALFLFFSGGFGAINLMKNKLAEAQLEIDGEYCGDGTFYNSCSEVKPYFCFEGKIISLSSLCGCPEGFNSEGNDCISSYANSSKVISLKYTLRGESNSLDFVAYDGFAKYVSDIPRSMQYTEGEDFSMADFKLKEIDEKEQRKFLLPLVVQIQNLTNNREDQARIAISLVQNIPFGSSNKTINFWGESINYTRYPYEVLYDNQGVCGEKTDLLSFLLRELGYGVSFFYYPLENHEALGIKCPVEESLMETGYCFIETTSPSIISDNKISYVGVGKLYSTPEFYILSEGDAIGENLEEYKDADRLNRIRDSIDKSGLLGPFNRKILQDLKDKYGLTERHYR